MKTLLAIPALFLLVAASPALEPKDNPQVDFAGFTALTSDVGTYRKQRLVDLKQFHALAAQRKALILDARSAGAFAQGHIKGAVNLPFTDFTAESLAATIGDRDRPILIYCNNNFSNDQAPVRMKAAQLALNIQTFVNLVGYGYRNVYELKEVVDFNDPKVRWVKGPVRQPAKAG
jgi:rhodanese-related sulfurtransferase